MIDTYNILSPDFERDAPRELMLLSIISQSFFQPFSLEDNLLVILTALTSGSGVGFNRAMLFLKQGDRLKGEMWLGPRSAEEAGLIWEVLSTPGIGYVEILEHNRALVAKNQDTLSGRLKGLVYAADEESALIPAAAVCRKELLHVRDAAHEPQVDRRFLNLIGVDEFLCVPLLARDDVVGVIVLDNAITRNADRARRHQAGRRLRPDGRQLHLFDEPPQEAPGDGEDGGHGRGGPVRHPPAAQSHRGRRRVHRPAPQARPAGGQEAAEPHHHPRRGPAPRGHHLPDGPLPQGQPQGARLFRSGAGRRPRSSTARTSRTKAVRATA
ncbi:MAG: GAF domain-containing protein [Candidatus Moduliflexus flocculans]|nr:GAF domain-containing protein [Candidatus Moduliflexus flocculans]